LKQLKKQAFSHEKNANKAKQDLAKTMTRKQKIQNIAKSHTVEVNKLTSNNLRIQTLKKGAIERARIDPIVVGRNVWRPNRHSKLRIPPN
jgi:hypothetical protein